MRFALPFIILAGLVLFAGQARGARLTSVDPGNAKVGDTLVANGDGLEAASVEELYLTDGTNDFKVQILEQTATSIKFKVTPNVRPGRWALMVRIKTPNGPQLVEQGVKVTIE